MEKNYRAELTGVFGKPVDENPTGVMEEAAYREKGLNFRYLNIKVEPEDLGTAMAAVRAFGMKGINLTIPHKVEVLKYLDELSEAAGIIGAVNTVVNRDGRLWGENTDGKGFVTSLKYEGISLNGTRIVGETLAALIGEKTPAESVYVPWEGAYSVEPETDILINATCIGLYPDIDGKPAVDYDTVTPQMTVCDVVFNPPETPFLREAARRGARTVNGLGMLANQGALNFTLWTGQEAPVEVMEETLRREFGL